MRRDPTTPAGELHRLTLESAVLKSNLLGDPTRREIVVYVPDGHDGRGLPLLVDLVGFTSGGPGHVNWKNFGENLPERLDRLMATGEMPPAVVAFPDCFTRLGGNQYINSAAMGRWEDFLIDEMLPLVEGRFGCGGGGRRGLFGKSSGGYGAIVHALRRADCWAAAACHSGDMGFELCYLPEMPAILRAIAKKEGSIEKFITDFEAGPKWKDKDHHILMGLVLSSGIIDPIGSLVPFPRQAVVRRRCRRIVDAPPTHRGDGTSDPSGGPPRPLDVVAHPLRCASIAAAHAPSQKPRRAVQWGR